MSIPTVGVVVATPESVPLTQSVVGRLSAYRSANVLARVAGVLLTRDYHEGEKVDKGQLLFQIDPAPFKAALDNAEAQRAEAKAAAVNDSVDARRAVALAPKGFISKTDLDNALAAERTSQAAVQAADASVETARINLGYTHITSPITGRAGEQQVTEGALVGQGTPTLLTTISQLNPLYVNFTVSVQQLDALRRAAAKGAIELAARDRTQVQVTLPGGARYPEPGTLDFAAPTVNPATGSVNLRAVLPNPRASLLPGSFVNLKLDLGVRRDAFLIPQAALQHDVTGAYVLRVGKHGRVRRTAIVTEGTHGDDWVVASGLTAGDRVIVTGVQAVHVGGRVKVRPWNAAANGDIRAVATVRGSAEE
ncbi:MAG TPA: efflux RND transporter periplasmic adaptor subunit [Rhodanobacteraceae bacterium]